MCVCVCDKLSLVLCSAGCLEPELICTNPFTLARAVPATRWVCAASRCRHTASTSWPPGATTSTCDCGTRAPSSDRCPRRTRVAGCGGSSGTRTTQRSCSAQVLGMEKKGAGRGYCLHKHRRTDKHTQMDRQTHSLTLTRTHTQRHTHTEAHTHAHLHTVLCLFDLKGMHAGFQVLSVDDDGAGAEVVCNYDTKGELAYGASWYRGALSRGVSEDEQGQERSRSRESLVGSCTFYDAQLQLWRTAQ